MPREIEDLIIHLLQIGVGFIDLVLQELPHLVALLRLEIARELDHFIPPEIRQIDRALRAVGSRRG